MRKLEVNGLVGLKRQESGGGSGGKEEVFSISDAATESEMVVTPSGANGGKLFAKRESFADSVLSGKEYKSARHVACSLTRSGIVDKIAMRSDSNYRSCNMAELQKRYGLSWTLVSAPDVDVDVGLEREYSEEREGSEERCGDE